MASRVNFLLLRHPADEVAITLVPFLAVFDDRAAREMYDTTTWGSTPAREFDLSEFLDARATRVHFNRYTGVAMQ